ncbi:MAG: hypothetical protein ACYTFW_01000 [Planctomycetota bacterium]
MVIESEKELSLENLEAVMRTIASCKPSLTICQLILKNRRLMNNDDIVKWCMHVAQGCDTFMHNCPEKAENLHCDKAGLDCFEAAAHLLAGEEAKYLQHCKMSEQHCWQANMRKGHANPNAPELMHA